MKKLSLVTMACLLSMNSLFAQILSEVIYVQAQILNVRADQSLKSAIIVKLKQLDRAVALEQGKSETIDGITDFWYKIKTETNEVGYVFGHLISLKKQGQTKIIRKFEACEVGEEEHLIFEEYDFGGARNNPDAYVGCNGNGYATAKPEFIGKTFELVINSLLTKVYCADGKGTGELCVESTDTIVGIRQLD
jgi:Bacterial SH3 domain